MGTPELNAQRYGQDTPPDVDIREAAHAGVPIYLIYARHDTIVTPTDSLLLKDMLGEAVVGFKALDGGHITFIVPKDASFVFDDVLPAIQKYNPLE